MTWQGNTSPPKSWYGTKTVTVTVKGKPIEKTMTGLYTVKVILATKCGRVILSRWLPENGKDRKTGRWEFMAEGEEPVDWFPWPEYPIDAMKTRKAKA